MSYSTAILVVDPATWAAIAPGEGAVVEPWHRPYLDAVTGYMDAPPGLAVYQTLVTGMGQLQALVDALNAHTPDSAVIGGNWDEQGRPNKTDGIPLPAPLVAMMRDIETESGPVAPTKTAPNFGVNYAGHEAKRIHWVYGPKFGSKYL